MKIKYNRITVQFTAGEALSEGDVVYISGTNEVKKASASEAAKVVGVADHAADAGDPVDVVIYGVKEVVADGAISVGDRVIAGDTAGRVKTENNITSAGHHHTENQEASYTQNTTTADATDTIEAGRTLGKALSAASAAGETIKILVCLA